MKAPLSRNERGELNRLRKVAGTIHLRAGAIELDRLNRRVTVKGCPVHLQPRLFLVLELLLLRQGDVLGVEEILSLFPGPERSPNNVRWALSRLRAALGDAFPVQNIRGEGYTIPVENAKEAV